VSTEKPLKRHPLDGTLGGALEEIYRQEREHKESLRRSSGQAGSPLLQITEEQARQIEVDQKEILALLRAGEEVDFGKYIRVKL
jgi:hypothetical protein